MIKLVPSTNNSSLVYDREDVLTLLYLQQKNVNLYMIFNKSSEMHKGYMIKLFSLYNRNLRRDELYIVGICDTANKRVCVVHRGNDLTKAQSEIEHYKRRIDRYINSSSTTYIRCIYPRINIVDCGSSIGIVPTHSPEARPHAQAHSQQAGPASREDKDTQEDSSMMHNNNNTTRYTMIAIIYILLIAVSFAIGMWIGNSTLSEPVEHEPTAYDILQDIHQQLDSQ